MSRFFKIIVLPLLLISVACVASVEGVYYWFGRYVERIGNSGNKKIEKTVPASPVRKSGVEKVDGLKGYEVIFERNLFSSSMEAGEIPQVRDPLEGVEASSLDAVLMGTVSGDNDGVRAIIYDKSEKKQEIYQVGDYIQQAVIKQILRGKVILNYNGRDEMLDISEARNVAVPRVAAASPVVVKQRVTGRPIGRPSGADAQKSATLPGAQVEKGRTENRVVRKPLRSFSGGLRVKGETADGPPSE